MALELENILITGSSGFIGTYLVDLFEARKISYTLFEGDLLEKESVDSFFSSHRNITQIVHLVGTFDGDIDKQIDLNLRTTSNLLEVADRCGIKKMIFTSTGAVYGEPVGATSLEDDPRTPNTWYGLSKKYAEDMVMYYARNRDFRSIILRFPNVYGKGSRGVISSFLRSIADTGKVTLYGDGRQSRNFLHVSDAVEAITMALSYTKTDIFNITNPVKTSLLDLIEILKKSFSFEVERLPSNNNLRDLLLSGEKARNLLSFEAREKDIRID